MSRISGRRAGVGGPVFCFAGHTDVVPTGPLEEWRTDPFVPTVRDGVLYGRGAADMKSGLAAMVTATEEFVSGPSGSQGTIAFLITSDEEGPSVDGTKRVVEMLAGREERIDWCVVGEPSSETALGDTDQGRPPGILQRAAHRSRRAGHVAYPQLAENPVHTLAPALAELTSRVWDNGTEHFQPTTFQVSNLNAGTGAPNVIPGRAQGAIQSALFAGADPGTASRRPSRASCASTGCDSPSSGTCPASRSTRRLARYRTPWGRRSAE